MGNTHPARSSGSPAPVHPHVRGEYIDHLLPLHAVPGSSPRAWGILRAGALLEDQRRFIPTCVGNTARTEALARRRAVHPHVRGEYSRKHEEFSKVIIAAKIYRSGTA
ncbi:hypothetical protein DESPIG_00190 [Desulfovibrio piger ATCC 29098]|nr:hypothetical protein DESPIG_00190 [Desulfovibrio piger ATCC 29098]